MTPTLVLALVAGVLFATGVYLVLARTITRALIGLLLMGNGANILYLVASGRAGGAPIVGVTPPDQMSDPLPQAMVLTAIVITLGMTAFLLALAHRAWQLARSDNVEDDLEDARITALAEANDTSGGDFEHPVPVTGEDADDPHREEPDDARERRTGRATRTSAGRRRR